MENNIHSSHEEEASIIRSVRADTPLRLGSGAIDIFILLILTYFIPVVGAFLGVGYYLFKDSLPFLEGKSIGKKIFQIEVQNRFDNNNIRNQFGRSFARSLPVLIPVLNIIELTLLLLKKRRLGDQWAKTFVVNTNKAFSDPITT